MPATFIKQRINKLRVRKAAKTSVIKRRASELKASDVFIASYPRSGNTWLRLLLADLLQQQSGLSTDTRLPIHQDKVIPNVDDFQPFRTDPQIELPGRMFKTHAKYHPLMNRAIVLFRHPADSLCSYYHYHRRYERMQPFAAKGIDRFCRTKLSDWIAHLQSYLDALRKNQCEMLLLSYESLHANPVESLRSVGWFLQWNIQVDECRTAIENHRFSKHQQIAKPRGQFNERFFRKGKIGGAREELSRKTLHLIDRWATPVYEQACTLRIMKSKVA